MICGKAFSQPLLNWFEGQGRKHLPWQQQPTPYRVWVSEIMLQQTQVVTVIPYFQRFTERFPDLPSLASASQDEVLHLWTGLGYYARGRNLHRAAQQVMQAHGGQLPESIDALIELPGIGRSTAGAILSLACQQRQPILDGNVKRVLSRFYCVAGWSGQARVNKQLWQLAEMNTPQQQVAAYTQAIMDLGATCCTRSKPRCGECPLQSGCQAYRDDVVRKYPEPKPRRKLPVRQCLFLMVENSADEILLEKRPPSGIWGGLWSLPQFDHEAELKDWCLRVIGDVPDKLQTNDRQRQTFTHFHLDYQVARTRLKRPHAAIMETRDLLWYKNASENSIGLAAPVKRLLESRENRHEQNG